MPPHRTTVRPLERADEPRWRELYAGYRAFYGLAESAVALDTVWAWLLDPAQVLECLVVVDDRGVVVGLAHFRDVPRPSAGAVGGYLDDLFVDPSSRGSGAVDALLAELRAIGARRHWSDIRWITAETNYRARAVYDRQATKTPFLTYSMALD